MKFAKLILFSLFFVMSGSRSYANVVEPARPDTMGSDTLTPVIAGDFADPSVIKVGDVYYAAGTSSEWGPHYPIYKSTNLTDWKLVSYIFAKREPWMKSSFWAPELFYYNNKVYAYYTARDTGNISCIGVATADDPEKGFTDHGVIIRTGNEAIDAFVFNDDGQLYVTWKAYGLDERPIELLSSKLTPDGLKLVGETVSIKRDDAKKGMEGQSMIKRDGYYYLLYSAGGCCGVPCDYNVRVSRSRSITGPFEEYEGNPILKENGEWMCTGHGTPVQSKDGRWFYLYHAYHKEQNIFTGRQGLLAEIIWNADGWPGFHRPAYEKSVNPATWRDDFDGKTVSLKWSWDYRNSEISNAVKNGSLELSGKPVNDPADPTVMCVRPTSYNYSISAGVPTDGTAEKGLILYGDLKSNIGLSVKAGKVIVWSRDKNGITVNASESVAGKKMVQLKIDVSEGKMLRFFYATDGKNYKEMKLLSDNGSSVDASFMKQWDRASRPGIFQSGKGVAKFDWFEISDKK